MRASTLLLLLLLSLAAVAAALPLRAGAAATGLPSSYPLSMGFGPSDLIPVGQGVPVYTAGDQLWLVSSIHMELTLTNPSGAGVVGTVLNPMDPVLLYTFSSSDPAGSWSLVVGGSSELLNVTAVPLVVTQEDLAPANLTGYTLSGSGQLQLNLALPATTQYDIQACAVGSAIPETVSIPIPATVGTGQLLLSKNGSLLGVSTAGRISGPFNFWVELHQNYSYSLGGPSTVVSRDVEVAATGTIPMSSGETSANATFVDYAQVRDGRFTLRAFFDTPAGISVQQAQVLAPDNSTWISLSGCSASALAGSATFSLSASLATNASRWPTAVYTMYLSEGVEMVSETTLGLMPAVLGVVAAPWGTALTDSQLTFTPGPGVEDAASGGGTLYLVAAQYPVEVAVLGLGGQSQTVLIGRPFSETQVQINSSKVSVSTYLNGGTASGASITILSSSGDSATVAHAVSGARASVFYLPDGNYTVEAALGNATQESTLLSQTGRATVVTFDFVTQSGQGSLYALLATAAVGAAASALLWIKVYRDRR
jgi:hypothetical protein